MGGTPVTDTYIGDAGYGAPTGGLFGGSVVGCLRCDSYVWWVVGGFAIILGFSFSTFSQPKLFITLPTF